MDEYSFKIHTFKVKPQEAFVSLHPKEGMLNFRRALRQGEPGKLMQPVLPIQPIQPIQPVEPVPEVAPTKKRKRSVATKDVNPRPAKFRTSKPVKVAVPNCIWNSIFQVAHPSVLLTCRDMQFFKPLLVGHPAVWQQSRRSTHGDEIPEPLEGLSEEVYADLRERKGCQVPGCTDKLARKTYWAFCRRWCRHHLTTETLKKVDALAAVREKLGEEHADLAQKLLRCLTSASLDSWGNYTGAGLALYRYSDNIFSVKEITEITQSFMAAFPNIAAAAEDDIESWLSSKQSIALKKEQFAKELEEAIKDSAHDVRDRNADLRKERISFFTKKAAEMRPPMAVEALTRCPAYMKTIKIPKVPTPSAWSYLKKKLQKERVKAEAEHKKAQELAMANTVTAAMGGPTAATTGPAVANE